MKKIIILGGGDLAIKTIEIINRDKLFKIIGYYNNQHSLKNIKFLGNFSKLAKQKILQIISITHSRSVEGQN